MTLHSLRERMRHSAAHVMADAVLQLFPEAKLAIGPPTEDGFYYDFEVSRAFTPEDLEAIEGRLRETIAGDLPFRYQEISRVEAMDMFSGQTYKLEIIDGLPPGRGDQRLQARRLCGPVPWPSRGLHSADKRLQALERGWRVLARRRTSSHVAAHLRHGLRDRRGAGGAPGTGLEEAQRRDHRRLARELDLLSFHEEYGPGLVYWHPKGGRVRSIIEDFWRREHYRAGYELVYSPHIGKSTLWETSGHLDFYAENMYSPMDVDGQDYYVKPMNCPFHVQIYKSSLRSYRELPMRLGELGTVYRYERSGVLHGLLRVRGFTQDDAHIFCRPGQVEDEIGRCVDFMQFFLRSFGFQDFHVYLSTRNESGKFAGSLEDWDMATGTLRDVIQSRGLPYDVDEGGAVFYGPKIDVKMVDALGREWQCTTIQFDFNLPERFDVTYIGEDGHEHRPYMVHRALLGSMERFFGVLIEHYAGAFPTWLAPVQAVVIPIADRHLDFAQGVSDRLRESDIRVDVDSRSERMNAKIRHAQLNKVPFMLVVGDKEIDSDSVSVRLRDGQDLGPKPVSEVMGLIQESVNSRV